jgi:hypothetical protein
VRAVRTRPCSMHASRNNPIQLWPTGSFPSLTRETGFGAACICSADPEVWVRGIESAATAILMFKAAESKADSALRHSGLRLFQN